MKKITIIALLVLIGYYSNAQSNDCKKIKKHVNTVKGITEYYTPSTDIGLVFHKTITKTDTTYQVEAYGKSPSINYKAKGIYLKLDNGDVIIDESVAAVPTALDVFTYSYVSTLTLNKEYIEGLGKFKVVKFGVSDILYDVSDKDAVKYQKWLACLLTDQ